MPGILRKAGRMPNVPPQPWEVLAVKRAVNLRQLLLATSRLVNWKMTEILVHRGYKRFRTTHLNIFSHIDLDGTRLNVLATRANMTKQAMWQLANELEMLGYAQRRVDPSDRRNRIIVLTPKGMKLLFDSFGALEEIESNLAAVVGVQPYQHLKQMLKMVSEPQLMEEDETYSQRRRSQRPSKARSRG